MQHRVGVVGPLLNNTKRLVRLMQKGPEGIRKALARRL